MALTARAILLLFLFACPWRRYCTSAAADGLGTYLGSGSAGSGEPILSTTYPPPAHYHSAVINYFSAFPCTARDFDKVRGDASGASALRILRTCDVFAYVASELAVRHVNQHRQGIFTYPDLYSLPDTALNQFAVTGRKVRRSRYYNSIKITVNTS